jgi:predicted metal-dependent enzyme (double-stranded beta helix superfamily)
MEAHGEERQCEHAMSAEDVRARARTAAVQDTVEDVRRLLGTGMPGIAQSQCAAAALQQLAARAELWPAEDFPIPDGQVWKAYTLHEDADGAYAMYAVPMHPGHAQPPHDHTTWALIAGVRGREHNRLYRRPVPGAHAPLELQGEITVGQGTALALGPDDIHAIEVPGPDDALHLHLYGRGLSQLTQRHLFDLQTSAPRDFPVIPVPR